MLGTSRFHESRIDSKSPKNRLFLLLKELIYESRIKLKSLLFSESWIDDSQKLLNRDVPKLFATNAKEFFLPYLIQASCILLLMVLSYKMCWAQSFPCWGSKRYMSSKGFRLHTFCCIYLWLNKLIFLSYPTLPSTIG